MTESPLAAPGRKSPQPMGLGLSDRRAIVTGGGRGLGKSIAGVLADAGARVCVLDIDEETAHGSVSTIRAGGGDAFPVIGDVSSHASVTAAAKSISEHWGGCDILVNNAGVNASTPLEHLTIDQWRRVVDINLTGTFLCSQIFGRLMLGLGKGAVVNVASVAGLMPAPDNGAYAPTKAAVLSLTRQCALEWGPRGIRVNAVCPGPLEQGIGGVSLDPAVVTRKNSVIPTGRRGTYEEVANVVAFLVSDLAAYVNGATVAVDGALSQAILREFSRA